MSYPGLRRASDPLALQVYKIARNEAPDSSHVHTPGGVRWACPPSRLWWHPDSLRDITDALKGGVPVYDRDGDVIIDAREEFGNVWVRYEHVHASGRPVNDEYELDTFEQVFIHTLGPVTESEIDDAIASIRRALLKEE